MKVINCRNVHETLPLALQLLHKHGVQRDSRNGPVIVMPESVTTVYTHPVERVIFWSDRDANPAFHHYESLWMLSGRQDIAGPARYVKRMLDFSDDGRTMHDAYGYRWRTAWFDQLNIIVRRLKDNPDDRRSVLQMWNTVDDLDNPGKAVPCNLTATFQRDAEGKLDLVVFCRSNDIIMGAYGANAVQFGTLIEYMAARIGCPVGTYTQISVNWHAYLNDLTKLDSLWHGTEGMPIEHMDNPYFDGEARVCPMASNERDVAMMDRDIRTLLSEADSRFALPHTTYPNPFFENAYRVLYAWDLYATLTFPERFDRAFAVLKTADQTVDWVVAMAQWLERRQARWNEKMEKPTLGYQV